MTIGAAGRKAPDGSRATTLMSKTFRHLVDPGARREDHLAATWGGDDDVGRDEAAPRCEKTAEEGGTHREGRVGDNAERAPGESQV